jgi:alkylation response protein AidB-like acyl-CoA dehydrogenase
VPVPLLEPSAARANDNVRAIQDLVAQITTKYDRSYYRKCVAEDRYPEELRVALGDADPLGMGLPEQWGGEGGGILEELAVVETLGRAGILAFSLVIGQLARIPVFSLGRGEAARRFVAATLRGSRRPCFALNEPDAGTNAFAMRTVARRDTDGDGWRVSGQKVYISGADAAEQMLLVSRTNDRSIRASASVTRKTQLSSPRRSETWSSTGLAARQKPALRVDPRQVHRPPSSRERRCWTVSSSACRRSGHGI